MMLLFKKNKSIKYVLKKVKLFKILLKKYLVMSVRILNFLKLFRYFPPSTTYIYQTKLIFFLTTPNNHAMQVTIKTFNDPESKQASSHRSNFKIGAKTFFLQTFFHGVKILLVMMSWSEKREYYRFHAAHTQREISRLMLW